jgi:hypothetical protein
VGGWAAKHPRAACAVYLAELAAPVVLWWVLFGGWAPLVLLGAMVALCAVLFVLVRQERRRKGLAPLPLWRKLPS